MKIVEYDRVSTKKQGESGLGLAAQRKAVTDYAKGNGGTIIAKYREIESRRKNDRPQLMLAIEHAKSANATLVIARLDRLSGDVEFTSKLMNSGVEFVCCDNPKANRLTMHILVAVAENEAVTTSRRTKDALAMAKANGVKLGSARPGHWEGREHKRGFKKGTKNSSIARSDRAKLAYSFVLPTIRKLYHEYSEEAKAIVHERYASRVADAEARLKRLTGTDREPKAKAALEKILDRRQAAATNFRSIGGSIYARIAEYLNSSGHETTAGKPFTHVTVWRVLERYGYSEQTTQHSVAS